MNCHFTVFTSLYLVCRSLKKLGSRLYVVRGKPEVELPRLLKDWEVQVNLLKHCPGESDVYSR